MRKVRRHLIVIATFLSAPANIAWTAPPADAGWFGYNNSVEGQRYSPLTQITVHSVARLKERCSLALGDDGPFQSGPLVIGDTLYVTTAHTTVALDAGNCTLRWRHEYVPEQEEVWIVNRGAAYADGRIFRGTTDGRLLALDAKTGALLWKVKTGDPARNEYLAAAPLVWSGKVYIGLAGSDWGIRGRMMAFDAVSGREIWRFYTIPIGSDIGAETWKKPASALTGGGGTWSSYALDPTSKELFVTVANPAPDYLPTYRPGDNLFTNSLVVLDAETGALKWWHQIGANDAHDWDLAAPPMLYNDAHGNATVALGSKDGHVYAIDRGTHRRVFKTAVTRVENADRRPTPQGVHVCPGSQAGVHWNGPALDFERNRIIVGSVDWCGTFKSDPNTKFVLGEGFNGGAFVADKVSPAGWLTALDAHTGKISWRYRSAAPIVAGVTPTAGGVVLSGDMAGNLLALSSDTGKLLLKLPMGGALAGGVITYAVGGIQYVAVTSGNVSRVSFQSTGSPRVVIMAIDAQRQPEQSVTAAHLARAQGAAGVDINWGRLVYTKHCAACHGTRGEGVSGPNLKGLPARRGFDETVAWIKNPKPPMPKLYPKAISAQDTEDIATYIRSF